MMDFKKVEGHDGLVRDMSSGAIVNRDTTGYQNYIALRNQKLNEKKKIENLEGEIKELKDLVNQLLQNINISR